jgi:hypothetical protein
VTTGNSYHYIFNLYKADGTPLGDREVEIDWEPALEWCHLLGIRRGKLPPFFNIGTYDIEPIWHSEYKEPYMAGFRAIILGDSDCASFFTDFPLSYFAAYARKALQFYVINGALAQNESFRYSMSAFPCEPTHSKDMQNPGDFTVQEVPRPLPLGEKSLHYLLSSSVPFGKENDSDIPVFIPQNVLHEAGSRTQEAGAKEVGGILIGYLHRESDSTEIMAEATAEIPAEYSLSDLCSLSFTHDTWTAVSAAIDLRNRDEIMLGWWHSHSYMKETCQNCKRIEDKSCDFTAVYMSDKDCALHRTAFYRAFTFALVFGDTPCAGLNYGLFGWRHGRIQQRAFHILGN